MAHLLCFGAGFSARALAARLRPRGWTITGTTRSAEKGAEFEAEGIRPVLFDGSAPLENGVLEDATHLLMSVPPTADGDPVLRACGDRIANRREPWRWVGYLSTTGVYGDHGGAWVDETTPPNPESERGLRRLEAENAWDALHRTKSLPVHIFRLAGIYGPGRNPLLTVRNGSARRIDKPGQVFSRIHVADIAGVLAASIARPTPGEAFNVCDDEPAPPQDVVAHACALLGVEPPALVPFEEIKDEMSPMARSFYGESKRCRNDKIKAMLGVRLAYPTYREGLKALLASLPPESP